MKRHEPAFLNDLLSRKGEELQVERGKERRESADFIARPPSKSVIGLSWKMSRPVHMSYYSPPAEEFFIQAKLRNKNPSNHSSSQLDSRDRLLQLAEKPRRSIFLPAPSALNRTSYCAPDRFSSSGAASSASPLSATSGGGGGLPRMGLRARGKAPPNRASAIYSSEQSLPDKLTAALKSLRPSALSHSASSSAPFKGSKVTGVVDADDVVYIPSSDKQVTHRYSPNQQRKARSIFLRTSPSQSELHRVVTQAEDPPLHDLEHIRALYKSTPNVSSSAPDIEKVHGERGKRYSQRFDEDSSTELSSSTRSPTDSGYRSASRHLSDDPYSYEEAESTNSGSLGISHKTTTIVHVGGSGGSVTNSSSMSPSSRGERVHLRCNVERPPGPPEADADSFHTRSSGLPFSARDVVAVLQSRRCRPYSHFLDASTLPKLVSLLEKPLISLTEEIRRLCLYSLKLTVEEVMTAIKVSFPLEVFSSCLKAGVQATTLFALSGTGGLKKSMSKRAELSFSVGKMYRWLIDSIPNKPMSDTVAVFLAATLECTLEELILRVVDSDSGHIVSLRDLEERLRAHRDLVEFFIANDPITRTKCVSGVNFSELIDTVHNVREKVLAASGEAVSAKQARMNTGESVPVSDWVRMSYAYAEHRMAYTVDEGDVHQAARHLLHLYCPPICVQFWRHELSCEATVGEARKSFAFQLISTAKAGNIQEAADMLEPDKLASRNAFGLCPLSEAIIQSNADAITALLSSNCPVNCGVPSPAEDRRPYLLKEYSAWTPLSWAVAKQKLNLVHVLLNAKADIENDQMIKESPLQIAVQLPLEECSRLLLEKGADPFRSSIIYDSLHAHFRNAGCASALALAAARGNDAFIRAIMHRVAEKGSKSVTMSDFLSGSAGAKQLSSASAQSGAQRSMSGDNNGSVFDNLAKETRLALQEAMYYAVETCRPEIAIEIKNTVPGLNWNIFIWSKALQSALEKREIALVESVLSDFGAKLAAELTEDTISDCLHVLFGIVRWQCVENGEDASSAASAISRLHHYLREAPDSTPSGLLSPSHRPLIDHQFINNQQFSDIKFMVGDRPIFGHRIVLINASDKFKELLHNAKNDVVPIKDVSHNVFLSMLEFIYTGQLLEGGDHRSLLPLLPAARLYQLPSLASEATKLLARKIDNTNFADLYTFAIEHSIEDLTTRCERFLLDNFAQLMGESSVRRLMAAKRVAHSYNVPMALSARIILLFESSRKKH